MHPLKPALLERALLLHRKDAFQATTASLSRAIAASSGSSVCATPIPRKACSAQRVSFVKRMMVAYLYQNFVLCMVLGLHLYPSIQYPVFRDFIAIFETSEARTSAKGWCV
jgi:hypothetical protein